jgi:hypothetical protein
MGAWRAFVLLVLAWWGLARAEDPPAAPPAESPAPETMPPAPAPTPPAPAPTPPIDQGDLNTWWKAAGDLWMDETAYKADGTTFDGGVCRYNLDEGVIIPVFTGKKPVSERRVGLVFIGKGTLTMSFPDKADAQAFANHMVLRAGKDAKDFAAIAHGDAPYVVPIENGLILSADPDVQKALFDLEPIGAGVVIKEAEEGGTVDEYYTVTEHRGKTRAKLTATNLIPQRRRLLQLSGIDPLAMLRQDRFLHEELGVPKEELRFVADFRTADHYRVAEPEQGGVMGGDSDRWLTCYRDPAGFLDSGYETMVFAHGVDREGLRHFERFDGRRLEPDADGRLADPPFEPLHAETTIEAKPKGITANYIDASVKSTITVKALGQDRYSIALALPNWNAVPKTFELQSLTTADGRELAWAGLYADLPHSAGETRQNVATTTQDDGQVADAEPTTSGGETVDADAGPSGSDFDTTTPTEGGGSSLDDAPTSVDSDLTTTSSMQILNQVTVRERYEIIAMLPEVVRAGETVTLNLRWKARWPYANWAAMSASDSTDPEVDSTTLIARPLGTTTGAQAFLPRLLPSTGLGEWKTKTTVGVPGLGIRTYDVAVTGDTVQEWQSEDGWKWITAQSRKARTPMVAIGGWKSSYDPRAMGLPAVSVHLFSNASSYLGEFAPEVRRVLTFLDKFLPDYPFAEVDVYQGAMGDSASSYWGSGGTDLIGIRTFVQTGVGEAEAERENSYIAQTLLARQLAGQYWGQAIQPASARDAWITDGLADAYALFYLRAALKDEKRPEIGFEAFHDRLSALRKNFESRIERNEETGRTKGDARWIRWSLTGSTTLTDVPRKTLHDYRTYFWVQMLRSRIGDDTFFPTLDQLAQRSMGRWVSTAEVQSAFEEASGQDLSAFFDQWVHGGLVPKLEAWTQRRADGSLVGCIHSDVPFGHLEVPVRVGEPYEMKGGGEGKDTELMNPEEALVDVVDGWGTFVVPKQPKNAQVVLDPDTYLMTIGRKVHAGEWNEACPAVP